MSLPNIVSIPVLKQRYQWIAEPLSFLEQAVKLHPNIFTAQIFGAKQPIIFVNHPQAIQEIYSNDRKIFTAPGNPDGVLKPLIGEYSLMLLDGEPHKRQRQLIMPQFHGERMQLYGEIISNITDRVFSDIPQNKAFTARDITSDISLSIMLQVVFGLHEGERYQQIKHGIIGMMDLFRSPLAFSLLLFPFLQKDLGAWSPWGNFLRRREMLDKLLYAEISERRSQLNDPNRVDILSLLMSARDPEGNSMTDKELRDEMMTLLVAGYETTATAMAWGLYWLHHKPILRSKLLEELDSLGENPDPVTIFKQKYLTAVCNETLRIYPVAMTTFERQVEEPVELLGHKLKPESYIWGCIYLLHHREDLYPDSKEFKPERFLERQFSPYEFMPFGGGVRRCVGYALALFEMKLVLAHVVSRYNLELLDDKPEKPQRRGVTIAPARGVRMKMNGIRVPQKSAVPVISK
ncbi:cytochrome P450 [Mastigocoleus testarum]|uniref:Cytochrome P450 n=1 Tax=Mastigocoleus testarum BC008 TaxID=371196 RepID=A0A0V7ZNP9_9CYAN|nr:cytochrome P450 [Mastigocoleus testarum]KST65515.1 cytochrome P450 [Mastigocoleus testarum BC008]KST66097.1 cytochrome P450 [Mastigocoleus testarum BC008]